MTLNFRITGSVQLLGPVQLLSPARYKAKLMTHKILVTMISFYFVVKHSQFKHKIVQDITKTIELFLHCKYIKMYLDTYGQVTPYTAV